MIIIVIMIITEKETKFLVEQKTRSGPAAARPDHFLFFGFQLVAPFVVQLLAPASLISTWPH